MTNVKITFFMLVTNNDCIIADFAIKSYQKIYKINKSFAGKEFVLFIYLNNLSDENIKFYYKTWASYPYTVLFDNREKLSLIIDKPYPGKDLLSPEGIVRKCDDYAENYDELWTTELKKFTTPFIATVDADFEILHPDFYFYLINKLESGSNLIGASTNHDNTTERPVYESYSNRYIILGERNHTWFCIYKKEAFTLSSKSHYYYEETDPNGKLIAYDSAAYFQKDLRDKGWGFFSAPPPYFGSYVHYQALSKNRTLNRENIARYRLRYLLTRKGLIFGKNNLVIRIINRFTREICRRFFGNYLDTKDKERSTFSFEIT